MNSDAIGSGVKPFPWFTSTLKALKKAALKSNICKISKNVSSISIQKERAEGKQYRSKGMVSHFIYIYCVCKLNVFRFLAFKVLIFSFICRE